jgi:hypothetical protein
VRVLYIIGCGRSGSTLLDTILGNHPHIESFGELNKLVGFGFLGGNYCACGRRADDCPFWASVRDDWQRRSPFDVLEYADLQAVIERTSSLFVDPARVWPVTYHRYATLSRTLYEALSTTSGKSVVVDSSKLPTRASALSRVPGIELSLIHLVRDPRGVAWSMSKRLRADARAGVLRDAEAMPAWKAALHWRRTNWEARWVAHRMAPGQAASLDYEYLTEDPVGALTSLQPVIGLDMAQLGSSVAAEEPLTSGHTVAGNRLRMQAHITVRRDDGWRKMHTRDRMTVEALSWPYMNRH